MRYSNMRVTILGRGPLAEPLAQLAERAGHAMIWVQEAPAPWPDVDTPDLVILAGSSTAVQTLLERVGASIADCRVVVDATIPTVDDRDGGEADPRGTVWIPALMKGARIVRAFASVPANAVATVLHDWTSETSPRLAVPLAGDDTKAKALVVTFMREIGVGPFDLGALANADLIAPGGALWGKALDPLEMLEAVGQLSGGG
jgi:predicted dinucleotide-binding enzyme